MGLSVILGILLFGSGGVDSTALDGTIRAVIQERARSAGEEVVIEAIRVPRGSRARCESHFTLEPLTQGRTGGHLVVMVDFTSEDSGIERVPVSCTIREYADAYVAKHQIDRHLPVTDNDVLLRRVEVTHVLREYLHDLSAFVGLRTQRIVQEGAVLTSGVLELEPTVHAGDTVVLMTRTVGVKVTVSALAKEDGRLGSTITVQPTGGHQRFRGKVIDGRTVERSAD